MKISGAVQTSRWTPIKNGGFGSPQQAPPRCLSIPSDSCRALMKSLIQIGTFQAENDKINLLEQALQHCQATTDFFVVWRRP